MLETLKFLLSAKLKKCLANPLGAVFYVTWRCNLRCKHCNLWRDHESEGELNFEQVKKILVEFRRIGIREINYSGGEPLLKESFNKILVLGRKLGFRQYISTNALLLDERWADILARTCDAIFVSLEGAKNINDDVRGKGHFEKALKAIKLLELHQKGIASISVTLTKWNVASLPELCMLCLKLGVNMGLQLMCPQGAVFPRSMSRSVNWGLRAEDVKKVASCIAKYRDCFSASDEYYQALLRTLLMSRIRPCVIAYRRLTIDPRGYIYPCSLWHKPVGHVSEGVLNVWFSENFEVERREMRKCIGCFLGCYEPDNITYEMFLQRVKTKAKGIVQRLLRT